MAILHMEIERVQDSALQLKRFSVDVSNRAETIFRSSQQISWLGPSRDGFLDEIGTLIFRIRDLIDEGETLAQRVEKEVAEWIECDSRFGVAGAGTGVGQGGQGVTEGVPAGYVDNDNVGMSTEERMGDIENLLNQTSHGREILKWLKENNVDISFGKSSAIAHTSADGSTIVIGEEYAHLSDYELAAILMHEGQHARNTEPFNIPIVGPIVNDIYNIEEDILYSAYPFPEEYRAHRAQAEFWMQVRDGQPNSGINDRVVDLIFNKDGTYRDIDAVYRDLHSRGYESAFDGWNPV